MPRSLPLAFWLVSFFFAAFGQPAYVNTLSFFAGSLGYAFFWFSLYSLQTKKIFGKSFFWFFLVQLVGLSWFFSIKYQGPFIVLVYVLVSAAIALQFAFFTKCIFSHLGRKKDISQPLQYSITAGLTWAIFEWLRLWVLSGFSFNPVGLCLSGNLFSLQLASLFGIYGLSFWVIFTNLLGFNALLVRKKSALCIWAFCSFFPFVFGFFHITFWEKNAARQKPYEALLLQTALTPEQKEAHFQSTAYVNPYEQWQRIFTEIAKEQRSFDLFVLPEVALPFKTYARVYFLPEIEKLFQKAFPHKKNPFQEVKEYPFASLQKGNWWVSNAFILQNLSRALNCEIIAGLEDYDEELQMPVNAAFHFSEDSLPVRYEKRVLVPLGEYIPFEWCKKLAAKYGIFGSFAYGKKAKVFSPKNKVAVSICYEETYPHLMRQGKNLGAELFVNISNDVWFPNTTLPIQHYLLGKIRTVENGVPTIRATNTGITAAVDAFGREITAFYKNHPKREEIFGTLWVQVPRVSYPTLHAFWGEMPILVLGILFWIIFLVKAFHNREIELAQKRLS